MKMTNLLLALGCLAASACGKTDAKAADTVDAVTGATPLALARSVPSGLSIAVNGEVDEEYVFESADLERYATTRIRTREVSSDGDYVGAYSYVGVPLLHLLEGVTPKKASDADFDRPLDMIVTVTDSGGRSAHFSYNEICMVDDAHPITLAYYREPVLPSKNPETYEGNKLEGNVKGLRLIAPADTFIDRYLDDVETITLRSPVADFTDLPVVRKGAKCRSDSLVRCSGDGCGPASLEGVEGANVRNWVRVGHGMGFKGVAAASGYNLISFLEKNFQDNGEDYFYIFIACDGYRSTFSGAEIFATAAGRDTMIITEMNGETPSGGLTLGPVRDYFVDRDVWGLSHIVQLKP
jgi:hypothetical protein